MAVSATAGISNGAFISSITDATHFELSAAATATSATTTLVQSTSGMLDLNAVRRRVLTPVQRIARHLWRMCFAFFIATGSFFLGQQDVLPAALHRSPILFMLAFAPFAVMAFWLVKLRFPKTIGRAPSDELAAQVHAETEGNPFFATEIARLLGSVESGGHLITTLPIPETVLEAIARRLERQSALCRETLMFASVIGREFDPAVVEAFVSSRSTTSHLRVVA